MLLSILFQGSLLPFAAKKADMLDNNENVLKTFTDYSDETGVHFISLELDQGHPWINCRIQDVSLVPGLLIAAVLRNQTAVMPRGDTCLKAGDSLIIAAKEYSGSAGIELSEVQETPQSRLAGIKLKEADIRKNSLVVLIQRQKDNLFPTATQFCVLEIFWFCILARLKLVIFQITPGKIYPDTCYTWITKNGQSRTFSSILWY